MSRYRNSARATGVIVTAYVAATAIAFGWVFRLYSVATIATALVFGLLSAQIDKVEAGDPTPYMGLLERIGAVRLVDDPRVTVVADHRRRCVPAVRHQDLHLVLAIEGHAPDEHDHDPDSHDDETDERPRKKRRARDEDRWSFRAIATATRSMVDSNSS